MFLWAFLDCEHFSDFPYFDDLDVLRSADQVLCWMSLTLSEVIFFTYLDWGCGFGEEDHRGEVPFLSSHIESTCHQHDLSLLMLTLITWLRQCMSGFFIVKQQFLAFLAAGTISWKTIFSWTGVGGCFLDQSSALHLLCILFLLFLHCNI